MGSIVYIVCSDVTRNGKTLLARLLADLLSLRKSAPPIIFDTDMSGDGIINYFPDFTRPINLSRIGDQVKLFDTMLNTASGYAWDASLGDPPDFIVDLNANDLDRFFHLFHDIGFEEGAVEAGLSVRVCFILRWTLKSLRIADATRSGLTTSRFITVRNMAVEAEPFTPDPDDPLPVPKIDIDLFLYDLSKELARTVRDEHFSFAQFATGKLNQFDHESEREMWQFLETVYNQMN